MIVDFAQWSHQGGRETQQDRVDGLAIPELDAQLFVVADGMGGHQGGELASQAVIHTVKKRFQKLSWDEDEKEFLVGLCREAHQEINRIGRERRLDPHSTGVFLFLKGHWAWWVHVGDCRLYHFRNGKLLRRTRDHSVAQHLLDLGRIKEEEMVNHPGQSRLLAGLGGEKNPEPMPGSARVKPGDVFLLCSDGLWTTITMDEMIAALAQDSLTEAARSLVEVAVARGGKEGDNVSVVLVRVVESQWNSKDELIRMGKDLKHFLSNKIGRGEKR
ncbi:MAG: serine/threonine-protein phosphatase [Magnetococcales bacterium]|nr:serine/threonine-protein phosphatase [Magnetococcales bacterium]